MNCNARIAQLVRALVLCTKGRGFEPRCEYELIFINIYKD